MITRSGNWIWMSLAALALLLLWQPTARADSYNVTINTSPLVGSSSGPFQILVALEDANGNGDGNNVATISDFSAGAGSVGALSTGGGVSGSLAGSLTFTDSDPSGLNYAMGDFTPGTTISFTFSMTSSTDSNPSATGFPGDEFLFFILDGTGNPITTTDNSTPDTFFLAIVQGSSGLSAQGFNIPGAAPTVVSSTSVPEPSTILLLAAGILALGLLGLGARRRCWAA